MPEASAASVAASGAFSSALLLQAARVRAAAEAAIRATMRMGKSFVRADDCVPGPGIPALVAGPQVNLPQARRAAAQRKRAAPRGGPSERTRRSVNPSLL